MVTKGSSSRLVGVEGNIDKGTYFCIVSYNSTYSLACELEAQITSDLVSPFDACVHRYLVDRKWYILLKLSNDCVIHLSLNKIYIFI